MNVKSRVIKIQVFLINLFFSLLSSFAIVMKCLHFSIWQVHKDIFVSNWPTGRGAVAPYCLQVKSLKVIHSASQRNPRKNKPPCLTFAETLVATGSSYNSYQLLLKCKQRLSNSNQIDKLSRGPAQTGEHYECEADLDYIYTLIISKNNKQQFLSGFQFGHFD